MPVPAVPLSDCAAEKDVPARGANYLAHVAADCDREIAVQATPADPVHRPPCAQCESAINRDIAIADNCPDRRS